MAPADKTSALVQGTLDMLILKTLALEPMHGYGIGMRLEQISHGAFQVNAGSLFPAFRRLEIRTQLVIQVAIDTVAVEESTDRPNRPTQEPRHQISPSEARMMRVMAAVCASHSRVARVSRPRPAAVSA